MGEVMQVVVVAVAAIYYNLSVPLRVVYEEDVYCGLYALRRKVHCGASVP